MLITVFRNSKIYATKTISPSSPIIGFQIIFLISAMNLLLMISASLGAHISFSAKYDLSLSSNWSFNSDVFFQNLSAVKPIGLIN